MTVPQIEPWPPAPGPSDPGDVFDAKAFEYTAAMEPRRQQMNAVAEFVNDTAVEFEQNVEQAVESATYTAVNAKDTSVAAASSATQAASAADFSRSIAQEARDSALAVINFAGKWDELVGALNTPATVFHNGAYWNLLVNLADATTSEPASDNGDWLFVYTNSELRRKLMDEATLYADFVNGDYRLYEGVDAGIVRNKAFSDLFNFIRSSAAKGFGASTLETVTADTARFGYTPELRKRHGLLIEEQRTNLVLWSEDFTQASWSKLSGSQVFADESVSPDGSLSADLIQLTSDTSSRVENTLPATVGAIYTYSLWMRSPDAGNRTIRLELGAAGGQLQANVTPKWQRFAVSGSATQSNVFPKIQSLGVETDVLVWGAQVEKASTASSYISTDGIQITRAADNCTRQLGSEFNLAEFTMAFSLGSFLPSSEGAQSFLSLGESGSGKRSRFNVDRLSGGGLRLVIQDSSGVNLLARVLTNVSPGTALRVAVASGNFGYRVAVNGLIYSGGQIFTGTPDTVAIGRLPIASSALAANAEFEWVGLYARAFSEAELITLTMPGGEK